MSILPQGRIFAIPKKSSTLADALPQLQQMEKFKIIAKTFQGIEDVLVEELEELKAENITKGHRMVTFTGDKEMLYRANFCLRTAVRILKPILNFKAKTADDVYEAVRQVEWADIMDLSTSFSVDSVVNSNDFRHSKFVAYKVKDAIVDYFREKTGQRPNISISNPELRLNIHITDEDCTLSLDSSGESLHQRGYRVGTVEAPINEVLAAALVKLSGWKYDCDLIDPFCGSGTILIEAALMARNIYPGVFRKKFGFENWKDFDSELLQEIYNDDSNEREFHHKLYGYDINNPNIEVAAKNCKSAGVADIIELQQRDFRKFEKPAEKSIIITNPPYGERLVSQNTLSLYKSIGERLKHEFGGGEAWIICSREECFDQIGLKPSIKIPLFNGKLDCEFRKYQMFEGKFNDFRAKGGDVKTDEEREKMAEKKRFRQNRESFKQRFEDEEREYAPQDFVDANPDFLKLRNRHNDFERFRKGRIRHEEKQKERDNDGERRGRRDKPFGKNDGRKGGGRKFSGGRRKDFEKD